MYSLYRAWLSLGPSASLPGTLPSLTGDLHVCPSSIGNYNSPQSNGLPDVTLQVGPNLTHFSAHKSILSAQSGFFKAVFLNQTGTNPITVPNINVDEFSSLLTFMYTGFLDLNFGNIYNILLATHILHMPRALEICRSFLIQNNPLEGRTGAFNIVKPIPSRKSVASHSQTFSPLFGSLQKSEITPFRAITGGQTQNLKPATITVDSVPENLTVQEPKKRETQEKHKVKKREDNLISEKTIVDVACCDGPVRFHRVLNKNYGIKNFDSDFQVEEVDRNVLLNKIMNENIRDKQIENENQMQTENGNEMFTCVYCNHTFKSQYCYQKHARRHLNPVTLEVKSIQKVENYVNNKREVKLLDMNVQYYPCKTCGSKFPSYYFVHKHRKMCHADEIGDGSDKSIKIDGKSNESNSEPIDIKNNDDSEIEVGND